MPKQKPKTYKAFRALMWETQGRDDAIDFQKSTLRSGEPIRSVYLQPKATAFLKDVWHCADLKGAKEIARAILQFGDVDHLELKGSRWVYVGYMDGSDHLLPGQEDDKRTTYRAR